MSYSQIIYNFSSVVAEVLGAFNQLTGWMGDNAVFLVTIAQKVQNA